MARNVHESPPKVAHADTTHNKIKTRLSEGRLDLVVLLVVLVVLWSWMLRLRITTLTGSFFVGYLLALFGFLVMVLISLALFWTLISYLRREYAKHKQLGYGYLLQLFFLWAAVEFVVATLVAVVWMGHGGSWDTVLPFGSFAPILAYTPLAFLARFAGFYGLSAVFVLVSSTVLFKKLRRFAPVCIGLAGLLLVLSWLLYRVPAGPTTNVQIMTSQTNSPVPDPIPGADLVVYSEYGLDTFDAEGLSTLMSKDHEVYYVGSRREENGAGAQNVLAIGSNVRGEYYHHAKSRLIPAGEYLPIIPEYLVKAMDADDMLLRFKVMRQLQPGPTHPEAVAIGKGVIVGSGVCASIISPDDYRSLVQGGATVLTNSAALGIFDSSVFDMQHAGLARFMAVANARPFLQSSTDAHAFALDHNGKSVMNLGKDQTAIVAVQTNTKKTPYVYLGEWVAYVGVLLILVKLGQAVVYRYKVRKQ